MYGFIVFEFVISEDTEIQACEKENFGEDSRVSFVKF